MTVVGFDISTTRLDWAWVSDVDGRPRCHHLVLGRSRDPLIDRLRNVRGLGLPLNVTDAVIEQPFSINRNSNASLMAVVGALTARLDRSIRVAWISPGDLRTAIGAENTKASAHERVALHVPAPHMPLADWNEHELDALVAAVGWQRILDQQEAA